MKDRLYKLLQRYFKLNLAFILAPLIIRVAEIIYLSIFYSISDNSYLLELRGLGTDLLFFFTVSLVLAVPFFFLALWKQKVGEIFFITIMLLVYIFYLSLVKYFITTLIPLDQVVFAYTTEEIIKIILSSTRFDPIGIVVYSFLIVSPFLILFLARKRKVGRVSLIVFAALCFLSPIALPLIIPVRDNYEKDFNYYLTENKLYYAVKKCGLYLRRVRTEYVTDLISSNTGTHQLSQEIREASQDYQRSKKNGMFFNPAFPFLRQDDTKDILGAYFEFNDLKPNLVFIIVESLTPSFFGQDPWFGSYMPFLDSLIEKSLYWENCLATSERTFGVLPALFGSLPYSDGAFLDIGREMPNHFSLLKYLKKNGYYSHFFYGGDPKFTNYDAFLSQQGVDYILEYYGDEYESHLIFDEWFRWGYPDGDMFERSIDVIDSFPGSPLADIYLTLSMHSPFTPPNKTEYLDKFNKRVEQLGVSQKKKLTARKLKHIFSTILYTDDMLRLFFQAYQKRSDFQNTIFIITGDHAMPELHTSYTSLVEKYHVPLIIYSPMIKDPAKFSVIISHLDITPTILAMLNSTDRVKMNPYCHWLGNGLDTTSSDECKISVSFAFNNKEEVEFLSGDYFISYNKLYHRDSLLNFSRIDDPRILGEMQKKHGNYLALTQYIVENNALIPDYLYFEDSYYTQRLKVKEKIVFRPGKTSKEFISVMKPVPFKRAYQYLDLDLGVNIRCDTNDTAYLPLLILEVKDSAYITHFHTSVKLIYDTTLIDSSGRLNRYRLSEKFDLGFIPDQLVNSVKMYFWNQDKVILELDSLTISIDGFYHPTLDDIRNERQFMDDFNPEGEWPDYSLKEDQIILQERIISVEFDTTLIIAFDSEGFVISEAPQKFYPIMNATKLSDDFRRVGIDIRFQYAFTKAVEESELPWLVLSIEDSISTKLLYNRLNFPGIEAAQIIPGKWNMFQLEETLEVNSLKGTKGDYLKLYFFNQHLCPLQYDSLHLKVTGIN